MNQSKTLLYKIRLSSFNVALFGDFLVIQDRKIGLCVVGTPGLYADESFTR